MLNERHGNPPERKEFEAGDVRVSAHAITTPNHVVELGDVAALQCRQVSLLFPKLTTSFGGAVFLVGIASYFGNRKDGLDPFALAALCNPLLIGGILWYLWKSRRCDVFVLMNSGERNRILANVPRSLALRIRHAVAVCLGKNETTYFSCSLFTLTSRLFHTPLSVYDLRWFHDARVPDARDKSKWFRRVWIALSALSLNLSAFAHAMAWETDGSHGPACRPVLLVLHCGADVPTMSVESQTDAPWLAAAIRSVLAGRVPMSSTVEDENREAPEW